MHIAIGTPMYGGMCTSEYTQSMLALKDACNKSNIEMTGIFLGNESLIQRARNTVAHYFLQSTADYLMFIDADQKFLANDIAKMIKADKGVIAGCVPMKGIDWKRVRQGAVLNHPDLSKLTGIFNVEPLEGHSMTDVNLPFQVKHVGTGFMLIHRDVFKKLEPTVGWYYGKTHQNNKEKIYNFFQVNNIDNVLLSEDYFFCHMYRQHGGEIWAAPWCELGHFGSYLFSGQYSQGM
jgi:hypothetical protein